MIKVIATDMDGTLLDENHMLNEVTYQAMMKAHQAGLKLIIVTGRSFPSANHGLGSYRVPCDYIVGSGAEVRDSEGKTLLRNPMSLEKCRKIYEVFKDYPLDVTFSSSDMDYQIGSEDDTTWGLIRSVKVMNPGMTAEEIMSGPVFEKMRANTRGVENFEYFGENHIQIYKILCFYADTKLLKEIGSMIEQQVPGTAVASSFPTNLEVTDTQAQKGPVLQKYIESLGYTMDEVMVMGDSLNDYSMMCMDFGATVAVANADDEIIAVSKYVTKSNVDDGAAYAIEAALQDDFSCLKK